MTSGVAADFIALIYRIVAEVMSNQSRGEQGVIVPGSYRKADGTVQVLIGTTAAIIQETDQQPLPRPRLPLLTPVHGMQAGPTGDERCIVVAFSGGFGVHLMHDEDDSPGAPAGEHWYVHPASKSFYKYTNDGATAGDGLGGARFFGKAFHQASTGSGHTITMDDTARRVSTVTAGGHTDIFDDAGRVISRVTSGGHQHIMDDANRLIKTLTSGGLEHIFDDAQREISHLAPNVTLGARLANLVESNNAMHNGHITEFSGNIMAQMMQSFSGVYSAAMMAAGIPGAPAFNAIVGAAGWILKNIQAPTIPSGSSIVKIAN